MTIKRIFTTVVLSALLCAQGLAFAQISSVLTVEDPSGAVLPSAGGILNPHTTIGRFGARTTGGYLSPTPNQGRLADNGMIFTPSGSFVGMNTSTRTSRFGQYWEQSPASPMPTESNLDLLENRMIQNQYGNAVPQTPGPQQVSATRPAPFPTRTEQPQSGVVEAFPETSTLSRWTEQPFRQPEQVWMRGSGSRAGGPNAASEALGNRSNANLPNTPLPSGGGASLNAAGEVDLGSGFIGGAIPNAGAVSGSGANAAVPISFAQRQMNPNQEVQEYLELMLLRSPTVNPLSPIQVLYAGGTATVRGIVPAEINRLEAGRILLSDPRVSTVDNRLTVLPTDLNAPLPATFDPNLPASSGPSQTAPTPAATPVIPAAPSSVPAQTAPAAPTSPAESNGSNTP